MYKLAVDYFKGKEIKPYTGKGVGKEISTLVCGGVSKYVIILSACANECEKYAASELQNYVEKVTGARLPIVVENENIHVGGTWISVGETALASTVSADNLNTDGFVIKTFGESVCIKGERDRGTLYGVYDFLEKFLCVRFLTKDYEYIPHTDKVVLRELDIREIPSFKVRSHHVSTLKDAAYAAKKRMVSPHAIESADDKKFGGTFLRDWSDDMHTYKVLLPYEKYGNEHPDWYSTPTANGKWQPAWSNGLKDDGSIDESKENSLIKELIKGIKQMLLEKPEIIYIAMGQNDNHNFSMQESCVRQRKLFGGYGGQQIVFVNAVAKAIKEWMEQEGIERELYFVVYAYVETHQPPTTVSKTGEIVPIHPLSVPRDDVIVMIAPYEASYNEPLKALDINDFNFRYYTEILGWAKISKNLFMFDYDLNFSDVLAWYPNTEAIMPNLALYKELGVTGVFTNGYEGDSHYQAVLDTYLFGKLFWNDTLDIEEIISEFNALFFGAEAGYMIDRLVRYIRNRFKATSCTDGYHKPAQIFTGASPWMLSKDVWNLSFITECERLVDGAKWYVVKLSDYDEQTQETYLKHLSLVEIMIDYIKWKHYDDLFDPNKKEKFMQNFYECYKKTGAGNYVMTINPVTRVQSIFEKKEKDE